MRKQWKVFVGVCLMGLMVAACFTSSAIAADTVKEVAFKEGQTPPAPEKGMVWCLVTKPAEFKTVTEKVQIQPATHYMESVPAVYEMKDQKIMTAPETKRAVYVPAEWKTVTEKVMVEEESTVLKVVPATYKTVEKVIEVAPAYNDVSYDAPVMKSKCEKIQVAPATSETVQVRCKPQMGRQANKACYAKVDHPAQFQNVMTCSIEKPGKEVKRSIAAVKRTIHVREVATPAKVEKVAIPAKFATIEKKVLVKEPSIKLESVPAQYTTVKVKTLVKPESKKKVSIPAKFTTITRREMISPAKMVWRLTPNNQCRGLPSVKRYGSVPATASYAK